MSDNKNESATITELMSSKDTEKSFFRENNVSNSDDKTASTTTKRIAVKDRLRENNMLVSGSELDSRVVDEYQRIKRPLLSNAFGKTSSMVEQGNLIMVTSSISGEGKTHTACNLALSIAQEKDLTVLLIDCDVIRQGVSRMLGVQDKKGLADVLDNENMTVADVIVRTDIPELTFLCAGNIHENMTESLASQRMVDVITDIASRYDDRVIVIDAPPLLPTPQTQVLAELMGQIIFVIEAGQTSQTLVEEALEMIPEDKATGLVMNKSEGFVGRSGYSYYGTYGSND